MDIDLHPSPTTSEDRGDAVKSNSKSAAPPVSPESNKITSTPRLAAPAPTEINGGSTPPRLQEKIESDLKKESMMYPFQDGIMVGIFTIMVHAALLFAALGQFYLLLNLILRFSYHQHEKIMRALAAAAGLLIYVGSKSVGVSIPRLIYESLETTVPISVGILGVAIPSMSGFLIAWYVVRFLNSADAVRNVVGMRVLSLIMTFVFFLYCDSYVATYGQEKSKDLIYLLPNITFVLSVLLYSIFKYHPEGTAHIHREEEARADGILIEHPWQEDE
jgi:hypothetical protein